MSDIVQFNCELKNLFDGRAEADTCIGGFTTLTIGPATVATMKAKGCIADGKPSTIVAGISRFTWDGTATSPMAIDGVVNSAGRGKLEEVKLKNNKLDVSFAIKILRTADDDSTWYDALVATTLKGVLDKNAGKGALWVDSNRIAVHGATETLYKFSLMVAPDITSPQQMQYAGAKGSPMPVFWGQPGA
jgi:hypothetical protein